MEKYWTLAHNLSNGHAPSPTAKKGNRSDHWVTDHGLLNKEPDRIASVNDLMKNHHLSMYDYLTDTESTALIANPNSMKGDGSDAFECGSEGAAKEEYYDWRGYSAKRER